MHTHQTHYTSNTLHKRHSTLSHTHTHTHTHTHALSLSLPTSPPLSFARKRAVGNAYKSGALHMVMRAFWVSFAEYRLFHRALLQKRPMTEWAYINVQMEMHTNQAHYTRVIHLIRHYSAKETYNLIDPTDRSHPISIEPPHITHRTFMMWKAHYIFIIWGGYGQ